jgi:hypothetical protein
MRAFGGGVGGELLVVVLEENFPRHGYICREGRTETAGKHGGREWVEENWQENMAVEKERERMGRKAWREKMGKK